MRRLFALVIVIVLVGAALYYWKYRAAGPQDAQRALAYVGDKIETTKTTGEVKAALALDRDLKACPIDVDSQPNGVVVLRGSVPSEELRAAAARVAASVPAVRRVVNELRIDPALPGPDVNARTLGENLDDRGLEAKIKLAFSLKRELKGTDLKVQAFRRNVTVGGEVDTPAQRQLALEVAQRTPAVAGVRDAIMVHGQGDAGADLAARAAAAERALLANHSLAPYGLRVRAQDGGIVLDGQVRTGAEKELAGRVAAEAAGVPVQNALQLRR